MSAGHLRGFGDRGAGARHRGGHPARRRGVRRRQPRRGPHGKAHRPGTLSDAERAATPRSQYFPEFSTRIGHLTVDEPGVHTFTLRAIRIIPGTLDGVTVFGATLRPA